MMMMMKLSGVIIISSQFLISFLKPQDSMLTIYTIHVESLNIYKKISLFLFVVYMCDPLTIWCLVKFIAYILMKFYKYIFPIVYITIISTLK